MPRTREQILLQHRCWLWMHKFIPKVRVELRSSVDLLVSQNPSRCDLPRILVNEHRHHTQICDPPENGQISSDPPAENSISSDIQPISDASTTTAEKYELVEILPPTNKHRAWNTNELQVFKDHHGIIERTALEIIEDILPKDSDCGILRRLTSPFEEFNLLPDYPNNIHFSPGVTSRTYLLYENCSDNNDPSENVRPHTSLNRPPTPPYKKHDFYKFARSSLYPVPSHYSFGSIRKLNVTKLSEEETNEFFKKQREEMASELITSKDIFEAFQANALSKGNYYYDIWQERELQNQKEVWHQYRWDMAIQKYFKKLKLFDEGILKVRPRPFTLINESTVSLIRKPAETPPDHLDADPLEDIGSHPPPPESPIPFMQKIAKKHLFKQRADRGPTVVPGGYLYVYYDVRETGEVFKIEEFEHGNFPDIVPPEIEIKPSDTPPKKRCLMPDLFTRPRPPHTESSHQLTSSNSHVDLKSNVIPLEVEKEEETESPQLPNTSLSLLPPSNPKVVTIAMCQMTSSDDKENNLQQAILMLVSAKRKQAKIVFFPEAFDFVGETIEDKINMSEKIDGCIVQRYQQLAVEHEVWLSLGGFHERQEELKQDGQPWLTNDHIVINPRGEIVNIYRKMHVQNSSYVKQGEQQHVVTDMTPIGKIGLGIGDDLRSPEFAMALRRMGADILTYPSAHTAQTSKVNWEALIQARAIESQCFVISANQCGKHNLNKNAHGLSLIVNPWGEIIASGSYGTGIIVADINLSLLENVRNEMPI